MLISLVFATLFLGQRLPSPGVIWNRAAGQTAFGMVLGFGQYLVGGLLVLLVLQPLFGTSPLMAALIEVGFEGAMALRPVWGRRSGNWAFPPVRPSVWPWRRWVC